MNIQKLVLLTSKLEKLKTFYTKDLGFSLKILTHDHFSVLIGESELIFKQTNGTDQPFYHFAFNIASTHFEKAKEWANSKIALNKEEGEDEVYFESFDARACYFQDPSGNVIELIARNSNKARPIEQFSVDHLMNISEINLTTDQVERVGEQLRAEGLLGRDTVDPRALNFVGGGEAFLLVGPPKRKWYFSEQTAEIHPVSIEVNSKIKIDVNDKGEVIIR